MMEPFVILASRFTTEEIKAIDEWRRRQPVLPNMSATLRYLVKVGLKTQKAKQESSSNG